MNRTDAYVTLQWRGVGKRYGSRHVWRNLEGDLHHGDVLAVVGSNGSGKSTLLRLFCGLESPSAGNIRYRVDDATFSPLAMRPNIGVVAPDIALYRELSALEHVRFCATARGMTISDFALHEQLAFVGLQERGHERAAVYSSGMMLRLKYALALLHRPAVLLLDEPTAMFDDAGRDLVDQIIRQQQRHGITIIATNDQRDLAWASMILRTTSDLAWNA